MITGGSLKQTVGAPNEPVGYQTIAEEGGLIKELYLKLNVQETKKKPWKCKQK